MWSIFKRKSILNPKDFKFQIETYAWLLRNYGGDSFYKHTFLVLPTKEFFPELFELEDGIAEIAFKYVKKYALMEEWKCDLVEQEADPDRRVTPITLMQGNTDSPMGTFSVKGDRVKISYNPSLVSDPVRLISTFAHELAHYLTATCKELPPGGIENLEFATEVTAVFMGFGIFMANSAFTFKQFTEYDSQGWSSSLSGYLTEAEFSFSLAIFIKLKNINPKEVFPHLRPNVKYYVKRALKELDESAEFKELEKTEYVGIEPNF